MECAVLYTYLSAFCYVCESAHLHRLRCQSYESSRSLTRQAEEELEQVRNGPADSSPVVPSDNKGHPWVTPIFIKHSSCYTLLLDGVVIHNTVVDGSS